MIRPDMTVSELMSTALVTANLEDTMDIADFEMKTAGIRHLLVIDHSNTLVGVVSDRDILRAFGALGDKSLVIAAIMSTRPVMIRDSAPAREALEIMLDRKISCLPVEGDDGQLVGVVTETDFMRRMYEELDKTAAA